MLDPNFEPFPVLTTERLVLRRFSADDAADFFEVRSNEAVMQYIARPLAKTLEDALALLKVIDDLLTSNNGITWCISLKNDSRFIGSIGFWRIEKENHRAEIGYLLNPAYHGRDIMQEALDVVLNFGFEIIGLHSVAAKVDPHNFASIKLLERNNFVREGYFKENYRFNNRFSDTIIYSLLTKL
ncbi:ribosomal-protein-alanine N-acetyltransferase [Mucilaginibacter pineti]|uniref:Ribosomal-protein-alanine N-acetyltransferase n=1 Tax=Mucilaginibacter pineti TaxID=1391627 RepID=A0A1G6YMA4_9SPHI|nr:GNAT family protein [Mucilaginibacter pineti]SDD91452.1 ribosomal-protein-alanine N-acetyltransferase [Mucilaginibacter pineti]